MWGDVLISCKVGRKHLSDKVTFDQRHEINENGRKYLKWQIFYTARSENTYNLTWDLA